LGEKAEIAWDAAAQEQEATRGEWRTVKAEFHATREKSDATN
jgi:hypothetical protein